MLLRINKLQVSFAVGSLSIQAVHTVNINFSKKSKTAIIGETGCGKSVLAAAVAGILPANAGMQGQVIWENTPLSKQLLPDIRGKDLSLIPQNPLGSLNPVLTAGFQVSESVRRANPCCNKELVYNQVLDLFHAAGFANPKAIYQTYPHQLSGGMAQRVLLAAAMAGRPKLIIADEPTKGLDLETRNQNVLLLHQIFESSALLLITHDIEVAATCSLIVVMYAGEIVETGQAEELLTTPLHPYTLQLLTSHPARGLTPIPGSPPNMSSLPAGCRFAGRCSLWEKLNSSAKKICLIAHPALEPRQAYTSVRCWHA
jgi:peptide/nickel transport system ATP-binding protein